jgi:hypothetical protein
MGVLVVVVVVLLVVTVAVVVLLLLVVTVVIVVVVIVVSAVMSVTVSVGVITVDKRLLVESVYGTDTDVVLIRVVVVVSNELVRVSAWISGIMI